MTNIKRYLRNPVFLSILILTSIASANGDTGVSRETSVESFDLEPAPWLDPAANSEQRQPLYLGATPREMALGIEPADGNKPLLYEFLRELGRAQAMMIKDILADAEDLAPGKTMEFEAWPAVDEYGQMTWVFARWRERNGIWKWFDADMLADAPPMDPAPVLPRLLDMRKEDDFSNVFRDVLERRSLYDKPLFGECIWINAEGTDKETVAAWVDVEEMPKYRDMIAGKLKSGADIPVCRALYRPARLNGKPVTFIITLKSGDVIWPSGIEWKSEPAAMPFPPDRGARIKKWPENFVEAYKNDVLALDGEIPAVFPISERRVKFKSKSCADKDNQLLDIVAYLEERYKTLGIKTVRQDFVWRGIPQANLIAVIPGSDPGARPVVMADHIDTAYCEDIYDDTGKRVSAPGADDNVSATAVLLRAAEILKDMAPRHEIWLAHLTGEEFPPDDLGARHFISRLLADKKDIEGLILMDMIGYREKDDAIFQINPGDSDESLGMAGIAFGAAKNVTRFTPVLRTRFDEKSYIYNTDGIIFSESGFPVVYLNEHMNKLENLYRKGYHHSTDTSMKMDWEYGSDIGKVAIETAAVMSGAEGKNKKDK